MFKKEKPSFFERRGVDIAKKSHTSYHLEERELKWHIAMKFWIFFLMDIATEIPIDKSFNYFHFDSFIRGYYLYQHTWTSIAGKKYSTIREINNTQS